MTAPLPHRETFPALTTARFVAAVVVVVFHLWRWDVWEVPPILERFVAAGPIAVTFFFVLSGFVMALNYTNDDDALTTTKRAFWRARFARVVPVHWLALLVALPIVLALWKKAGADPAGFVDVVKGGLASLLLVQAWIPGHELAINPPAWSIAVEGCFYALFPFVGPRLAASSKERAWPLLIGLWALSVLPGGLYLALDPDGLAGDGVVVDHRTHALWLDVVKYHPLVRLPELLLGVVAGAMFRRGARMPGKAAIPSVVNVVAIVAAGWPYVILHNGLLAPFFAVIIVVLASLPSTSLWAAAPLQKLGEASYAIYALHVPLLWWISGIGERRTGEKILEQPAVAAVAVVVVVVVSRLVFVLFEDPLRRRLRGRR